MTRDSDHTNDFHVDNNKASKQSSRLSVDERTKLLGGTSASRSASDLEHGRVKVYPHAKGYSDMFTSLILPTSTSVDAATSADTKEQVQQKNNSPLLILIYGIINTIMCKFINIDLSQKHHFS